MLAASVALEQHNRQKSIRKLQYLRAQLDLLVSPKDSDAADRELDDYYAYFNELAGTNLNPAQIRRDKMKARLDRYEALTGYKLGSPEFNAAVDATIRAMNA